MVLCNEIHMMRCDFSQIIKHTVIHLENMISRRFLLEIKDIFKNLELFWSKQNEHAIGNDDD